MEACADNENFLDQFAYFQICKMKNNKIQHECTVLQNGVTIFLCLFLCCVGLIICRFACGVWLQHDCFEVRWHYNEQGMQDVQNNCPLSCGICTPEESNAPTEESEACQDVEDFADAFAY